MSGRTKTVAKVFVIDGNGRVLVLVRSKTDPHRPGGYDLPGGGIDDEPIETGTAREVKEESGISLQLSNLRLVYAATGWSGGGYASRVKLVFTASVDSAEVMLSDEHDSYAWVEVDSAISSLDGTIWGTALQYCKDRGLL